jgi:hypothetical protein
MRSVLSKASGCDYVTNTAELAGPVVRSPQYPALRSLEERAAISLGCAPHEIVKSDASSTLELDRSSFGETH